MESDLRVLDDVEGLKTIITNQQLTINKQETTINHLKQTLENLANSKKHAKLKEQETNADQMPVERQVAVLLIEDNYIAIKIAKTILSTLNCRVDVAIEGKMALQLIEMNEYDLIFMDIGLPDMTGYELTQHIRAYELNNTPDIAVPIVALTAHGDDDNKHFCFEAGMNEVLSKPLRYQTATEILQMFVPKYKVKDEI